MSRKPKVPKSEMTICTKKYFKFCEICAHFFVLLCYYNNCKNPPIHYIVFATPHKKKYLLQKRQPSTSCLFYFVKIAYQAVRYLEQ